MIENLIGKRYASALSGSIPDAAGLSPALDSLKSFVAAFKAESRLSGFFAHPGISREKKSALVQDLAGRLKAGPVVTNLLLLLVRRNRILQLGEIADCFERVVDQRRNQVRVSVTAAAELSTANKDRLAGELGRILGKTVLIECQVDESLIGGVLVRVGDRVVDATLKNRLAILKRKIETEEGL